MGIIGTILVFTLLVIGNVWCSRLLIHVTQYCKKHVYVLLINNRIAIKVSS